MFNIAVNNNTEVKGDYNQYSPIPAGVYQVMIESADIEVDKIAGPTSKNPGKKMTMVSLKFDVYGAAQDGGSRPLWENIIVDHEVKDDKMQGFVTMNQHKLTDLVMQFIKVNCHGDASQSPFANGVNAETIGYLASGQLPLHLEIAVNKKSGENEVKSYFPVDAISASTGGNTQPQNAASNQQAQQPVQQQQQMNQQQPQAQGQQVAQGGMQQPQQGFNPNSNLPPFHQQQRTG